MGPLSIYWILSDIRVVIPLTSVFGVFGAQAFVVLIVAVIALVPVILYYEQTSKWFVAAYGFLLVGAFTTNFENLFLPDILNFTEHLVGNMGAGIAFAVAAYMYRQTTIVESEQSPSEMEG